jgi:hypothetical protein
LLEYLPDLVFCLIVLGYHSYDGSTSQQGIAILFEVLRIPIAHVDSGGENLREKAFLSRGRIQSLSVGRSGQDANFLRREAVPVESFDYGLRSL